MRIPKPSQRHNPQATDIDEAPSAAPHHPQSQQAPLTPQAVLQLQRTRGNRATQAIIQRKKVINDDVEITGTLKSGPIQGGLIRAGHMYANYGQFTRDIWGGGMNLRGDISTTGKVIAQNGVIDGAQESAAAGAQVAKSLGVDEG